MRRTERGMSLIEVLVALAILAVIVGFSARMTNMAMRGTRDNVNKQFATQKAISMLEELRALIQTQSGTTTIVLDNYDDGTTNQPLLTTQLGVTDPAAASSGNVRAAGNWLYERRITVQRVPGANDLRIVNVKVFVRDHGSPRLLAEVAGVLSTIGQNMPPTQVYDVYLIAIENVPGWWVYMDNIVPFVENAMQDLESRHPGLQFRKHWIRKLAYGRDLLYRPFVNDQADAEQSIDRVYFYPGRLADGSPVENYYPTTAMRGQMRLDANPVNDASPAYSFADQFNHALRHPDELALFQQRVAAGLETADAPTLRLLLDDMNLNPNDYRNAIIINLHGELFPFPPVRNYSDAAKHPPSYPYTRVVTHPERITYNNGDAVRLRVYSYHNNLVDAATVPDKLTVPISIVLEDIQWIPSAANAIVAVAGGIDLDGNGVRDSYARQNAGTTPTNTAMWYSAQIVGDDTILRLYNSPLKTPCTPNNNCSNSCGVHTSKRLYALEYVPSPVEDLPDLGVPIPFSIDLATQGNVAKNTARWVITIPASALTSDRSYAFQTRIGDDLTTGAIDHQPSNLSRTYVWRGSDLWKFGSATVDGNLPLSERFQILGDPRHCPYADLKLPHAGSGRANADPLGMGYNRYFDDFQNDSSNASATWPGWNYRAPIGSTRYGVKNDNDNHNDGWDSGSGHLEVDIPRIYQMLRTSVMRTHSVYTTMTGFSYYYVGIGGEIGYDASNGFTNSIPISAKPFTGGTGSRYEQSITDARINNVDGGVKYIRQNTTGSSTAFWWSMSWLGELAPDAMWDTWAATGNLPTGTGTSTFSRALRANVNTSTLLPPPAGTTLLNTVRRTHEEGCTTFFWSGSADSTFHHQPADNTTAALQSPDGTAIADTYKLPMPDTMANSRPFGINVDDDGMIPNHFLQQPYGAATTLQPLAEFYRHTSGIYGSALLAMRSGNDAAFVVVNGLSPAGESGVAFISRWSFLSLIQSFLEAGTYTTGGNPDLARVRELPRVVITQPNDNIDLNDPNSVQVIWTAQWRRWDGLRYTPSYANNFTEDTTIRFAVLYSRDNGRTWLHMSDDTLATPGTRPDNAHLQTATTYNWPTPRATFPKGNYLIRIEAYRDEIPRHYAFHQYRAFVKR
ncbi:MAG TPA: prepilin-type N-terminal cleavage/methylation domain-containing protein [Thermoanaerobaculia bacterium]|nr:prepilin-type N-terminal cleavage/methylation domain-containing protein [Thermoanaerobaculia bacterium]